MAVETIDAPSPTFLFVNGGAYIFDAIDAPSPTFPAVTAGAAVSLGEREVVGGSPVFGFRAGRVRVRVE